MGSTNEGRETNRNPAADDISYNESESFSGHLESLTRMLRNSTIGFALFDRNLLCISFNGALRGMMGVSVKKHVGEQLRQVFPGGAPKLELAFRRVWSTRNSLSNLELTAQLPASTEPRRWLVNFYPISDESGRVQLVAATLSEVTQKRCVELKLSRLIDKFHSHALRKPNPLADEFSELSARTLELVNRSVALLKNSLSLRFYCSEMLLETALVRHALFMNAKRPQESTYYLPPQAVSDETSTQTAEPSEEMKPTGSSPSPRERQILYHLADGKSNKEIGSILDISTRTVECYRARIMLKLDLHSTAALVRYAVRNKIVEA